MNDPDQAITWPGGIDDGLPADLLGYDELTAGDEQASVDLATGLVSLAFIRAALRRRARVWCLTALIGLAIGTGLYVKFPPAYQASASVFVTDNPNQDPAIAIANDVALAQSTTVATNVVQQLGLKQTVSSLLAAYTVTPVTDNVLKIQIGAPSSADAVSRVQALAKAFLQFHAQYARAQQQQMTSALQQQVSQAQQQVNSIDSQVSRVSAEPTSHAQQTELTRLKAQQIDAANSLAQVKQYVTSTLASSRSATSAIVNNSQVLDPAAPTKHSHLKGAALYVAGGLVGGLALGMAIVAISAVASSRLRRRDDIAEVIGAPVRLSVGSVRKRRIPVGLPGRASAPDVNLGRVVTHLRRCVPGSSRGPAGLAVVAVDDAPTVARAVGSLAASWGNQGKQIVVADLSDGLPLAHLLGVKDPGIHAISLDGAPLVVVVPDRDDVAPIGPLPGDASPAMPRQADEALVASCASADIVLTLATLDPAFGGDYLATWATDAVAVVTAGQSTAERIHGVGEMVRLAGTRLDSVVLIDADKADESLGVTRTTGQSALGQVG